MAARLTFLGIAIFWLTMNGLLWQAEYGVRGGDAEVPLALVWRKILTTPDASSLTVFQHGERIGYCEFSTSVSREMATVDAESPMIGKQTPQAGYQIHLAGNIAYRDFSKRLKFDGDMQFNRLRQWREFHLKLNSRQNIIILHATATNEMLNLKMIGEDSVLERDFTFAELKKPDFVLRSILGDYADVVLGVVDLPDVQALSVPADPEWTAVRTRAKIGAETMPVYRLQTTLLGHDITVNVSTLGEVLQVDLPGNISARIDEWRRQ
jgi:hypothetical protein